MLFHNELDCLKASFTLDLQDIQSLFQIRHGNASMGGARGHLLAQNIENGVLHRFVGKVLHIEYIGNGIRINFQRLSGGGLVNGHRSHGGEDVEDNPFHFGHAGKEIRIWDVVPIVQWATIADINVELAIRFAITVDHHIMPNCSSGILDCQMGRITGLQIGD